MAAGVAAHASKEAGRGVGRGECAGLGGRILEDGHEVVSFRVEARQTRGRGAPGGGCGLGPQMATR